MSGLDWVVMGLVSSLIIGYGYWKSSRSSTSLERYTRGDSDLPWYTISLSVIATQASAVTFLSVPGQAYTDGMRFVMFYLGLPLAMIFVSAVMIPFYYRQKVYTAYEFLETYFDTKVRVLTACLFLLQRSLAAAISIAAPAIVLSVILDWPVWLINICIGLIVTFYTVSGGSKAVSQTQKLQMITILSGMLIAGILVIWHLPKELSFGEAMHIAGKSGKLNTMDFSFSWDDRYNLWSGLIGGFFLQMAYFGTDQSQVGRYLGGKSLSQIRLGLLFNGVFKIPMQFGILFIGAMLFVFYQFVQPPVFFNPSSLQRLEAQGYQAELAEITSAHEAAFARKKTSVQQLVEALRTQDDQQVDQARLQMQAAEGDLQAIRGQLTTLIKQSSPTANTNDANYIFLTFVTQYLPAGLVGLLITAILFASMSTTASELSALSTTAVWDVYKKSIYPNGSEHHYLNASKLMVGFWGLMAVLFAQLATQLGTLIEAVNFLGSIFYGTVLGVFLLAFITAQFKALRPKATAVFWSALMTQIWVAWVAYLGQVAFLWLNMLGCLCVMVLAYLLSIALEMIPKKQV
ncbi:sodium:solute symporter [Eisenibacter elegans]|jgi:Na+/proline symporter|uniref:sodium:solute symporter n=1 Tax=Eisenibacter elegans TaxID=997 RepID=UPI00040B2F40|nr:sodium:solute symporter [Eisenibacter elegans]